jgi:ring-1,2-phenylacetyl-CoA epoxidase subunit PaaE
VQHFHRLTVDEVRRETADCVSLRFAVPPPLAGIFRFHPGQHLTVRWTFGGEELRRSYSICSALDSGELRVAVKRVPGGRFSSWANEALAPGDALEVMSPAGHFGPALEPGRGKTWLAIAAGSGITPVISILASALEREPRSRALLFYGNRQHDTIVFREELEDLKNRHMARFSLFHVLSREPREVALLSGRIDRAKLEAAAGRLFAPAEIDHALICGPLGLIDEARAALVALGVPERLIAVEFFAAPDSPPAPADGGRAEAPRAGVARVTVLRDGVRTEFDAPFAGQAILDAAAAIGLELPFSCKGGVCASCRCKLAAGRVAMARDYALAPWEREAGYVLACQSRPLTDAVTLDFDAS